MDSSSQELPLAVPHLSRTDIRRAVHGIIRRVLLQGLAQHDDDTTTTNNGSQRLNKAQRKRVIQQSRLLEDIIYRRACSIEEYQDLSTLEQRVFNAGRAVYITSQRRAMERATRRRRQAMNGDATIRAVDESEANSRSRTEPSKAAEPLGESARRSDSLVLS
mmetsp:Transcript_17092/g.32082  ORF Transcript_17092/g.32082 Transcript_17092/m.32082 type:complete len:162 (+) Transcript_17092:111-596(+)|eukprot:CAMPEP_0201679722 /NCGR_PEP_ID=MMETSP0494-20130426/49119_1 /ASSEMBLY_ACC=CAM_ASM_000839 /TAXON_ID=420259 /ORGANISM="Thalassiosira gravida, Strain GMp14c1" /LENGTH=161 /DNA_ID=CAMNT_0048163279 /DNA_START=17 /DNA_END=502 /DNA_ORIENTATION=+